MDQPAPDTVLLYDLKPRRAPVPCVILREGGARYLSPRLRSGSLAQVPPRTKAYRLRKTRCSPSLKRRLTTALIQNRGSSFKPGLLLALLALAANLIVAGRVQGADADADADNPAYKLTIGDYRFSETGNAVDINLRHTNEYGNQWVGYYESRRRDERQARAGWDDTLKLGPVRFTPSGQTATHGYFNWSVNLETGDPWYVGAGFGRTNQKPNWNLNFDPNDSWSVSAGWRKEGASIGLLWVRDDRDNPDQRHLHLVYRKSLPAGQRVTIDILHKRGLVDGAEIHRTGASFIYDWPRFFIRIAYDPKVNFTSEDMWRLAVGTRF